MFVYLGFDEDRENYQLNVPVEYINDILVPLAFACELLYAKAIAHQSARYLGIFYQAAAGVDAILSAAWGSPKGDDREDLEDGDDEPVGDEED